jgi:peroxiredoxin
MVWLGALSVVVALALLAVVTLAALVFELTRQLGRTLVRVDALEAAIAEADNAVPTAEHQPRGLPVGSVVPEFELPTVDGGTVSASTLRGRRALLVHWRPDCGFCREIAGELAAEVEALRRRHTDLILLSHGDRDGNCRLADEHGLRCLIALDESSPATVFGALGTPAAYLLDEKGRVAKPLALGALEVPALVRELVSERRTLTTERPLSESRIMRDGLKAGTVAPTFVLPGLDERRVDLAAYRGRRVLVVFSDPECGPCEALMPDLVERERRYGDALSVVMVSRGEVAENRARRDRHEAGFPIALQRGWTISKQYGIFSTPVAFLIDPDGVLEQDVARGAAAILHLADTAVARREEVAAR